MAKATLLAVSWCDGSMVSTHTFQLRYKTICSRWNPGLWCSVISKQIIYCPGSHVSSRGMLIYKGFSVKFDRAFLQFNLKWMTSGELAGVENIELSSASSPGLHRETLCKVHSTERGESLLSGVCFNHFSLWGLRSRGLLKAADKL